RAVGGKGGSFFRPADCVAELGREHESGEEQQVLRPLPRPHRGEPRAKRRPPFRKGDELRSRRKRHGAACYGAIKIQEEPCRPRSRRTCTTRTPEPRWTG